MSKTLLHSLEKLEVTSEMLCFLYVFLKQIYNLAETRDKDFLFLSTAYDYHQVFSCNLKKGDGGDCK